MRRVLLAAFLALPSASQADVVPGAQVAAAADGLTTLAVIAKGGVEANPLMPGHPMGIVAVTALKMAAPKLAPEAAPIMRSVWGGAAVNNALVLLGAANPVGLIGGVAAGVYLWSR